MLVPEIWEIRDRAGDVEVDFEIELDGHVRVNAVVPGTADTPWVSRLLAAAEDPEAAAAALRGRQPTGRLVTAAEVAHAIAYLASPLASATTGTLLAVDGAIASDVRRQLERLPEDATHLVVSVGGNDARFINHSCTPNCWIEIADKTIWIRASRTIAPGEELTYDYATDGEQTIQCRCRPGCKTML